MKLLLILLLVAALLWLLRGARTEAGAPPRPEARRPPHTPPHTPPRPALPVPMVSCAFCGLHLPRDEAFDSPNRLHYCCEAHRIEHMKQQASGATRGAR